MMKREVNLGALRRGDPTAVSTATHFLRQDGFVFIEMTTTAHGDVRDDELLEQFREPFQQAADFLQGPARGKGSRDAMVLHGHVSHRYKDSLRLLSGNQFATKSNCPFELKKSLETLVHAMDNAAQDITQALAQHLFQLRSAEEVGRTFQLPLLDTKAADGANYGLVDLVCYHNDAVTPEVVVAAHEDPGLLILALPEMAPGLQLLAGPDEENNEWVSPPPGMGVLWAGKAAQGYARPCSHRVVTNPGTPRIACWHEICTCGQICQPLLERMEANHQELVYKVAVNDVDGNAKCMVQGTKAVLEHLRQSENHDYPSLPQPPPTWIETVFLSVASLWRAGKPDPSRTTQKLSAGVPVPDTVGLPPDGKTSALSANEQNKQNLPSLQLRDKNDSQKNENGTASTTSPKKLFDNNGLGYTVTVEPISRKAGVPGPKVEEVTIRVTVRKNQPKILGLFPFPSFFSGRGK
ncbi:expressed unknown protein [Seminavis robusta]|uniref:Uncharacterized protein n=1 Tax=Seminavis robusta TaxID=568900 RepID=A0A9N8F0I7_9STRA|nr:expressed unknown protein [Seminavis robusta]|eukprot:Sro2880_g339220.1 n/a (465) ;mRNA; r:2014-3408